MSTHYFRCQGKKEINAFIFHDLNCPMPEFNFLVLPDSLGGGVVNLKHQFSLRDATIFHFHETKYALVEIKESGLTGWFLNTDKIISALKSNQLNVSVGECICEKVLNSIQFQAEEPGHYKFKKVRPDWLRCSYSGRPLELDFYNDELKIAVEYNGKQHYDFIPYFHQTEENFQKQLIRDEEKNKMCLERGIHLITVPYTLRNFQSVENFIKINLPMEYFH
jgi:hypothetical protein